MMVTLPILLIMMYTLQSYGIDQRIIWNDPMNSTNTQENWRTHGTVNTPTYSPLNSTDLCWSMTPSSISPNPHMYRITDLSSFTISTDEILVLNYDILPWNLSPNAQCQLSYAIITDATNIEWQSIVEYDYSENGIQLSEAYQIPITDTNHEIGIKFMLFNTRNDNANSIASEHKNICYLSSIQLRIETFDTDTITAPRIDTKKSKASSKLSIITGNDSIDSWLFVSFGLLLVILCSILVVVLFGCCCMCKLRQKTQESVADTNRTRVSHTKTRTQTNTVTSLQIGRIDPEIVDFGNITPHTPPSHKVSYMPSLQETAVCTEGILIGITNETNAAAAVTRTVGQSVASMDGNGETTAVGPVIGSLKTHNLQILGGGKKYVKKRVPSSLEVNMDDKM